ncbi:MAG TPA: hypothetical protein VHZ30_05720, partial [Verrucomicrobiae bacterium]|nr:hypothetical protein [Verrucomicrobiae bacterium]
MANQVLRPEFSGLRPEFSAKRTSRSRKTAFHRPNRFEGGLFRVMCWRRGLMPRRRIDLRLLPIDAETLTKGRS